MEITFIDFETATGSRNSACSLGIVRTIDNENVEEKSWLIRPPHNEYDFFNIEIHGITPSMTKNSPSFGELWDTIQPYFSEKMLAAHNASFDMSVLRAALSTSGKAYPDLDYICTLVMARASLAPQITYRLDYLCDKFNISFKHHDAVEDARASFELYKKLMDASGCTCVDSFFNKHNVLVGNVFQDGYSPCKKKNLGFDYKTLKAEGNPIEGHPFYGKTIAITGTLKSMTRKEAAQEVINIGANFSETFNKKVNYLVVGDFELYKFKDSDKSSKLRKAEDALLNGAKIEVISEIDFLRYLPDHTALDIL